MTTTISKLRIGQRFSWIPAAWYGPCRLTEKTRRREVDFSDPKWPVRDLYDLKYAAAVINPPGVSYGIPGTTRVRLLKRKEARRARS